MTQPCQETAMPVIRMRPARLRLLGWLAGGGLVFQLLAADGSRGEAAGTPEYLVRSWHIEDGLPDASILAIEQTPDGYLWLGTPRGLVRFDGAQFRLFEAGAASGLPEARITDLLVDHHGALWAAGVSGSLSRFESGRFQVFRAAGPAQPASATGSTEDRPADPDRATRWMWGRVTELAEDETPAIWLVLPGRAVFRHDEDQQLRPAPTEGLPAVDNDALTSDTDGGVWLAAGDALYTCRDARWVSPPAAKPLGGPLPRLARARGGGVWVAAPRGSWITGGGSVRRFKDGRWSGELDPTPWTPNSLRSQVTALLEDHSGHVWLGTLWGGVYCSDGAGHWQRVGGESPFWQCVITGLFEDRQGAIWVGTIGEGLHRVTRRPVTTLVLPPPANENIITASCAARDGSEWVGTDGAGAFRHRQGRFRPYGAAEGLGSPHVCAILEDRRTNLWVGTWGGLYRFAEGRFARVGGPPPLSLPVLALFEDRAGSLWIGTPKGLVHHDGAEFSVHALTADGGDLDIRSLAEDGMGNLWIGTIGGGLFRWQQNRVERFGPEQGFHSLNARSLYCDAATGLWIGTDGAGLARFRDGRFQFYSSADGLPSDSISSITADSDGNLWMGSDNGIFTSAPQWLEARRAGHSPMLLGLRLGLAEGLGSRVCSGSGQPVTSRSADGRLWFPNMRGLAVLDPRAVTGRRAAPRVLIESVLVDGVEQPPVPSGERRVPSSARRFTFQFTAPDLMSPQSLWFRHKLEGMDSDWVEAGPRRTASYSQLPPGHYRFRVMAGGADGQWHEGPAPFALQVVPRFWQVLWVRLLVAAVAAAAAIGGLARVWHRRVQRQVERLRMQQALENERRRIARDLHDDLGARLTELVLLGELAKRGAQTPDALQGQLGDITQRLRQLVTAMEEIVWTVNPKNDSLPNLVAYLCDYTERFLAATPMSCRLDTPPNLPPLPLSANLRHNLLLAVKETLNNAARHAAATRVSLHVHLEPARLRVEVADDGCGFDPTEAGRHRNGLHNLRSRMEAVGGTAEVTSAPGSGTRVVFRLPIGGPKPDS
jgi:ligand-binding sensor domain-containing protein/signal transduction histidine kinase